MAGSQRRDGSSRTGGRRPARVFVAGRFGPSLARFGGRLASGCGPMVGLDHHAEQVPGDRSSSFIRLPARAESAGKTADAGSPWPPPWRSEGDPASEAVKEARGDDRHHARRRRPGRHHPHLGHR
jgi:hypothetical protein